MARGTVGVIALACVLLTCAAAEAGENRRYFREDHSMGATYLALAPDGKYSMTFREHVGVWVAQTGGWKRSGERIAFTPKTGTKDAFVGKEVRYKDTTFLAWEQEAAPGLVIPIEETKREIDKGRGALVLYVFLEITEEVYKRETAAAYPFRTRPKREAR